MARVHHGSCGQTGPTTNHHPGLGLVTDSGIGAQSTGNRGMVLNKVGARLKLGAHS